MTFIAREEEFICGHCDARVAPLGKGSYRNHCPICLWSKHVDKTGPGDRLSECQGLMEPTGMDHDGKRGWMIVHECVKCGKKIPNKVAPDDDDTKFPKNN